MEAASEFTVKRNTSTFHASQKDTTEFIKAGSSHMHVDQLGKKKGICHDGTKADEDIEEEDEVEDREKVE